MYTAETLRGAVRALLQNIDQRTLPNLDLDRICLQGLRRLSLDKPSQITDTITGTGIKSYALSSLTLWAPGFSTVVQVMNPTPDLTVDDSDFDGGYSLISLAAGMWIQFDVAVAATDTATVVFTAPWTVAELDGSYTSTIVDAVKNALELVSAAFTCYALAAKSAGHTESQIPADLINWRTKQAEYKEAGDDFMRRYGEELNLITLAGSLGVTGSSGNTRAAAIKRGAYPVRLDDTRNYLTHRSS